MGRRSLSKSRCHNSVNIDMRLRLDKIGNAWILHLLDLSTCNCGSVLHLHVGDLIVSLLGGDSASIRRNRVVELDPVAPGFVLRLGENLVGFTCQPLVPEPILSTKNIVAGHDHLAQGLLSFMITSCDGVVCDREALILDLVEIVRLEPVVVLFGSLVLRELNACQHTVILQQITTQTTILPVAGGPTLAGGASMTGCLETRPGTVSIRCRSSALTCVCSCLETGLVVLETRSVLVGDDGASRAVEWLYATDRCIARTPSDLLARDRRRLGVVISSPGAVGVIVDSSMMSGDA